MVDTTRRKLLATHLQYLCSGQISNDEYEEAVMNDVSYGWFPEQYHRSAQYKTDDPVIPLILEISWGLYNDTENHKLKGKHALTDFGQTEIARYILFLQTDFEYAWENIGSHPLIQFSISDHLLSLLTLGWHYRKAKRAYKAKEVAIQATGDVEVWPFKRREEYEGVKEGRLEGVEIRKNERFTI